MFNKLGLLALATPLVNALTLNIPTNPMTDGPVTISWTFVPGDPPFSLELTNEVFHNSFAIANNVQPELQSIDIVLPSVPVGAGYTLEAVDIGNINNVFASTGSFAIAANPSDTPSSSQVSNTQSTGVTTTVLSTTGTGTSTGSLITITSATGSVTRSTGTNSVSSTSGSATSPASQTNQQNAPSTTGNSALSSYKFGGNMGTVAAALFSALAGAAIVVL